MSWNGRGRLVSRGTRYLAGSVGVLGDAACRPSGGAADIEEAFLWYERQHAGLGEEFLAAVQSTLSDIVQHPLQSPVIHRDTRRVQLRRFPYHIFYRVFGDTVIIVACMHGRRDPSRWRSRT